MTSISERTFLPLALIEENWKDGKDGILVLLRFASARGAEAFSSVVADTLEEAVHRQTLVIIVHRFQRNPDRFLLQLAEALDQFNMSRGEEEKGEIAETRIIQTDAALHDAGTFSIAEGEKNGGVFFTPPSLAEYEIRLLCSTVFGSGMHPSTRAVIALLKELALRALIFPDPVLDIGCGSGILSILCAKLGAGRVEGFDICEESVNVARQNVLANNLQTRISFHIRTILGLHERFRLIVANLAVAVQHTLFPEICRLLDDDGQLVLAGFEGTQKERIMSRCEGKGLRLCRSHEEEGWHALCFERAKY